MFATIFLFSLENLVQHILHTFDLSIYFVYNNTMKTKELVLFLYELDKQGIWLIPYQAFILKFKDEKVSSVLRELNKFVSDGILFRASKGLYINLNARSMPGHDEALIQLAKKLRPNDQFYLTLDARANELGLILQVPNRLTFATDGRSYVYKTPIGIIEFVHQNIKDISLLKDLEYDDRRGIYVASKERVLKDAKRHRRNYLLSLMEELV